MKQFYLSAVSLAAAAVIGLSGCGGGGDTTTTSSATTPTLTGVFVDAPVKGLYYKTATLEGFTDANGTFMYRNGERITFRVGGVELGSTSATSIVTPITLGGGDVTNPSEKAKNIAYLLQNLDADANVSNGIDISTYFDNLNDTAINLDDATLISNLLLNIVGNVNIDKDSAVRNMQNYITSLTVNKEWTNSVIADGKVYYFVDETEIETAPSRVSFANGAFSIENIDNGASHTFVLSDDNKTLTWQEIPNEPTSTNVNVDMEIEEVTLEYMKLAMSIGTYKFTAYFCNSLDAAQRLQKGIIEGVYRDLALKKASDLMVSFSEINYDRVVRDGDNLSIIWKGYNIQNSIASCGWQGSFTGVVNSETAYTNSLSGTVRDFNDGCDGAEDVFAATIEQEYFPDENSSLFILNGGEFAEKLEMLSIESVDYIDGEKSVLVSGDGTQVYKVVLRDIYGKMVDGTFVPAGDSDWQYSYDYNNNFSVTTVDEFVNQKPYLLGASNYGLQLDANGTITRQSDNTVVDGLSWSIDESGLLHVRAYEWYDVKVENNTIYDLWIADYGDDYIYVTPEEANAFMDARFPNQAGEVGF